MNQKKIQQLIELVEKSNINELEVSRWGTKVKITKNTGLTALKPMASVVSPALEIPVTVAAQPKPVMPVAAPVVAVPEKKAAKNLIEIKSPMVGTFYRAPSPDAEPYVKIGDTVAVGQVMCIIEAMKLMNEIESEVNGRVVEIVAENGKPVEYNKVLFLVEPIV